MILVGGSCFGKSGAVAFGAGQEEVGKELHFDSFEAGSGTSLAAPGPRVKREVTRRKLTSPSVRSQSKELAQVFEGAQEDGRSGARSAGQGRLVNELHPSEFIQPGDFCGSGLFVDCESEVAGEVVVNDGMSQGRFSGSGDARETSEYAEGEFEREIADVVCRGPGDLEVGLCLADLFGR